MTRTYLVTATRITTYEVQAAHQGEALDKVIDGDFTEMDTQTTHMDATPLCPVCHSTLAADTTIERDSEDEPTYCETCQRTTGDDTPPLDRALALLRRLTGSDGAPAADPGALHDDALALLREVQP
jgi:hypothetical protein